MKTFLGGNCLYLRRKPNEPVKGDVGSKTIYGFGICTLAKKLPNVARGTK
jgi:hypothetical protein